MEFLGNQWLRQRFAVGGYSKFPIGECPLNQHRWRSEDGRIWQREELNCDAVAAKASAAPTIPWELSFRIVSKWDMGPRCLYPAPSNLPVIDWMQLLGGGIWLQAVPTIILQGKLYSSIAVRWSELFLTRKLLNGNTRWELRFLLVSVLSHSLPWSSSPLTVDPAFLLYFMSIIQPCLYPCSTTTKIGPFGYKWQKHK